MSPNQYNVHTFAYFKKLTIDLLLVDLFKTTWVIALVSYEYK